MVDPGRLTRVATDGLARFGVSAAQGGSPGPQAQGLALAGQNLQVCTYNLLAPCYFQELAGELAGVNEAHRPDFWKPRFSAQLAAVLALADPDLLCLQEVWFEPEAQQMLREVADRHGYHVLLCQRTGYCDKEDGLAVLLRRARLEVLGQDSKVLCGRGSRVLQMALVRLLPPGAEDDAGPAVFVLGCTHLTHPHNEYDDRLRTGQAALASQACSFFAAQHGFPGAAQIFAGDLNARNPVEKDAVLQVLLGRDGWRSAFAEACGREARATHRSHTNKMMCADFVLLRGPVQAVSAALLPQAEGPDTEVPKSRLGAAAAAVAAAAESAPSALTLQDWSQLSDHRPLVATVRLVAAERQTGAADAPVAGRGK